VTNFLTKEDDAREMARSWFGYGRWSAPYWFVGMEPGGDDLDVCVQIIHAPSTFVITSLNSERSLDRLLSWRFLTKVS